MTKGWIYCFNTIVDASFFKAGHTQQPLWRRLKNYTGPNKLRTLMFAREVDDSVSAEKMMLSLLRQSRCLIWRKDLGNEWFQADPQVSSSDREAQLLQIADVVELAARIFPAGPESTVDTVDTVNAVEAIIEPVAPRGVGGSEYVPYHTPFLMAARRSPYFADPPHSFETYTRQQSSGDF